METILEAKHISQSFNGVTILEDVSFSLQSGTITSLFGENGSGKTTLFHIITGYLNANSGKVLYKGKDLNGKGPVKISQMGIGRVWQSPRICENLSVLDNLMLASRNHPGEDLLNYFTRPYVIYQEEQSRKNQVETVASKTDLSGKLQKTADNLSLGQQKLLSIGMLLMNEAELLILDEPFAGVNEKMINQVSQVLIDLKDHGKTIFIVEHNRRKAEEISDDCFTLKAGSIIENESIT